METCNKSKSFDIRCFIDIFIAVIILSLIFGVLLFGYSEEGKSIAYISIPGKESCIKEVKHYCVYGGDMITLTFTDGTKITTSTRNVTLVKAKKE